VDDAGARKFDAIVTGATLKAIELGTKVELAAASVVAFTAKVASGLDNLYWASQRTGATVQGIKQIGYAVSQMGAAWTPPAALSKAWLSSFVPARVPRAS
jgi:hypothetical protein